MPSVASDAGCRARNRQGRKRRLEPALKKAAALLIGAVFAACGGDPPPPPAQDTARLDPQREALEQRVAELEKQVSRQASQTATPPAPQATTGRHCVVEVAGKYCLGGGVGTLPPNPDHVAGGTHSYDDGSATLRQGEIVLVSLDLAAKSWAEFITLERTLTDSYGPPDLEGTTVPASATDTEAQALVSSGQAVYARTWLATDYSIRLWADATKIRQQFFLFDALDLAPDGTASGDTGPKDYAPEQIAEVAPKRTPPASSTSRELVEALAKLEQLAAEPAANEPLSVRTSARVAKRSAEFCTWEWRANIVNRTQEQKRFYLKVDFVDREGYSLDYITKSVAIGPESSKQVTGQALVKLFDCGRVASTRPQVEFY